MNKVLTTIITGFLGSGKTTIIQNTIQNIWDKEKIAIIKNEIGDVGVDALELSNSKIKVTELPNGCICCTLVGALNDSINEILEKYKPDRLFIEASGFAKPGQIVIGLDLVDNIQVDGVIVVIDALNYKTLKEIEKSNAAKAQSEFVNLYIINKADQVMESEIDIIKDDILGNYPSSRIIETKDAKLPADLILGLHENYIDYELENHEDHHYEDFDFFNIENIDIKSIDSFKELLGKLPKTVYRIKGYFKYENNNYILNGVAGVIDTKIIEKEIPDQNKFVFIGKEIKKYEKNIRDLIEKL